MLTTLRAHSGHLFGGVLLLLLGLRMLLLAQYVLNNPFAEVLLLDAKVYDTWAQTIARGDWSGTEAFHQAPLYPYFLALLYSLFGVHLLVVYLVQGMLSIASAFLFYQVGKDYFDPQTGKVAALLALGFGFYAFYSLKILPITLVLFLILLLLWQLRRSEQTLTLWNWFLSGILSGLTVLASPSLLLFTGTILLWIALLPVSRVSVLYYSAVFLGGVFLLIAPVTGHNFFQEGDLILVSANGGETFYQGNNPQAKGTYTPIPALSTHIGEQRVRAKWIVEEALGRKPSRREVSHYWWQQGFRYIQQHPLEYLLLLGNKLYLTFSEKDVSLIYFAHFEQERFLPLLRFFILNQYLLLPFCMLGLFFYTRKEHFLLLAFLGVQIFTLLLFYVSTRYRLLLTPVVLLFAGKAISSLPVLFSKQKAQKVFLITSLLILTSFCIDQRRPYARADQHYNLGIVYNTLGAYTQALAEFQEVLQYRPTSPQVLNNMGVAYYELGHYQQAIAVWQLAKRFDPSLLLDYNLAMAYTWVDREKAVQQLRTYLQSAQHMAAEREYIVEAQKRLQELQEAKR